MRAYVCIRRCPTEVDIDAGYTFSSQGNFGVIHLPAMLVDIITDHLPHDPQQGHDDQGDDDDKKDGGDDNDDNDDDDRQCMCAVATFRPRQHFLFATKTPSLAPALFFRLFTQQGTKPPRPLVYASFFRVGLFRHEQCTLDPLICIIMYPYILVWEIKRFWENTPKQLTS